MTENPRRLDACRALGAIQVEHCDIPGDMTLGEWRRQCAAERVAAQTAARDSVGRRLRRLLRG